MADQPFASAVDGCRPDNRRPVRSVTPAVCGDDTARHFRRPVPSAGLGNPADGDAAVVEGRPLSATDAEARQRVTYLGKRRFQIGAGRRFKIESRLAGAGLQERLDGLLGIKTCFRVS